LRVIKKKINSGLRVIKNQLGLESNKEEGLRVMQKKINSGLRVIKNQLGLESNKEEGLRVIKQKNLVVEADNVVARDGRGEGEALI